MGCIVIQMVPSEAALVAAGKGAEGCRSSVAPAQLYVVLRLRGVDACQSGTVPPGQKWIQNLPHAESSCSI